MSEQNRSAARSTPEQPWVRSAAQRGGATEEIGQGPGLDPPSAQPDPDDRVPPGDEAYADRPTHGHATLGDEVGDDDDWIDGAAIQRPPDDS